jgi:nicotinamidase-related amidase
MIRPVLLLLDYQKAICEPEGAIGRLGTGDEVVRRGVLGLAAQMLEEFRSREEPIIHSRVAFDSNYHRLTSASDRFRSLRDAGVLLEGDPDTEFCSEVLPTDEEVVVTKGCVNPFVGTNLSERLIPLRATELVVAGVATNQVVESTVRYAADIGYRIVVLEDLCASFNWEMHGFSVDKILPWFAKVTTGEDYRRNWK